MLQTLDLSDIVEVKSIEVPVGSDAEINELLAEGWDILWISVVVFDLATAVIYVLGRRDK